MAYFAGSDSFAGTTPNMWINKNINPIFYSEEKEVRNQLKFTEFLVHCQTDSENKRKKDENYEKPETKTASLYIIGFIIFGFIAVKAITTL